MLSLIFLFQPQIIESFGYTAETHYVVTEDDYILAVHRIPYGIAGPSEEKRPIAFLQHGLWCSSSDWVMDKPGRALGKLSSKNVHGTEILTKL